MAAASALHRSVLRPQWSSRIFRATGDLGFMPGENLLGWDLAQVLQSEVAGGDDSPIDLGAGEELIDGGGVEPGRPPSRGASPSLRPFGDPGQFGRMQHVEGVGDGGVRGLSSRWNCTGSPTSSPGLSPRTPSGPPRASGSASPARVSPFAHPGSRAIAGLVCELVQAGRFTWSEPAPGNRSGGSVLLPSPVGIRHRCDDRIRTVVVPND